MNSDEIKMEVNIAGERISLTVPFSRQEAVRSTEAEISALYRAWSSKFPKKSPKELMAMMVYKFASSYFDLIEASNENLNEAETLLDVANRLLDGSNSQPEADFPLY